MTTTHRPVRYAGPRGMNTPAAVVDADGTCADPCVLNTSREWEWNTPPVRLGMSASMFRAPVPSPGAPLVRVV